MQLDALDQARAQVVEQRTPGAGRHARRDRRGRGADAGRHLRAEPGERATGADRGREPVEEPDARRPRLTDVEPAAGAVGAEAIATVPAMPWPMPCASRSPTVPSWPAWRHRQAQNEIDQRYFRNQTKPQVDLVGSYTLLGPRRHAGARRWPIRCQNASDAALLARLNDLSHARRAGPAGASARRPARTLPDFLQGGLGSSLANLARSSAFRPRSCSCRSTCRFGNRTAEANQARAVIDGRDASTAAAPARTDRSRPMCATRLQQVRSAEQRVQSAGSAQRSAREQYDSERRRFESGLSTVFLVLQRQTRAGRGAGTGAARARRPESGGRRVRSRHRHHADPARRHAAALGARRAPFRGLREHRNRPQRYHQADTAHDDPARAAAHGTAGAIGGRSDPARLRGDRGARR